MPKPFTALTVGAIVVLAGCTGEVPVLGGAPTADTAAASLQSEATLDTPRFNPFSDALETATAARELVPVSGAVMECPRCGRCEDVTVHLEGVGAAGAGTLDVSFAIAGGRLAILPAAPAVPNLRITVPRDVLTAVIRRDLSWDEAFIGYWCRFDRHPNVYHSGFWRLFQAPYLRRPVDLATVNGTNDTDGELTLGSGVASTIRVTAYALGLNDYVDIPVKVNVLETPANDTAAMPNYWTGSSTQISAFGPWATPTSMRNVDVECEARVVQSYEDPN